MLSLDRKIGRLNFMFAWVLVSAFNAVALSLVLGMMGLSSIEAISTDPMATIVINYGSVPALLVIVTLFAWRCRDAGLPTIYSFMAALPVLNIPFALTLLMMPGVDRKST